MPLTRSIPKPMAPYLDSTLIEHGIGKVRRYIPNVHVTVGYKAAVLAPHLIEIGVSTVLNTDGHSNAWWLFNSLIRHLDEPLFVLTCDNVTDVDFGMLEADYFDCGQPACMLVPVRPVPGLAGDYIFHEDGVVTELSRDKVAEVYCSGIQVIHPGRANRLTQRAGDFYQVWRELIEKRQLRVSSVSPSKWFSVDTLSDLEQLNNGTPTP